MYKITVISIFILFLTLPALSSSDFAPKADDKPLLVKAINDACAEVDLKWSTLKSDSEAGQTGTSKVVYLVFRKNGTYFSDYNISTLYSEGIVIDTVYQTITLGIPDYSFIYWSDNDTNNLTSNKLKNNNYYTYSIVALDLSDSQYSLPSDTLSVFVDTAGPIIQGIYGSTPANRSPVSRSDIIITLKIYEHNGLTSDNLFFHYGFNNDPNLLFFAFEDTISMNIIFDTPYYYASAILPLSNIGANTVARFYISGNDNITGMDEPVSDSTPNGNPVISAIISDSNLLSWSNSFIYFLDEEPPQIIGSNLIESGSFVKAIDTNVYFYIRENVALDTSKIYLKSKSLISGQIETSAVNINQASDSYYITASLPLSRYRNIDKVVYYLTGTDKAGNNLSSIVSPSLISELGGSIINIDNTGPVILDFKLTNNFDTLDLSFSRNDYADSLYKVSITLSDSTQIREVYLKFYSTQNHQTDLTNYIMEIDSIPLIPQYNGDTYWLLSDTSFIQDTEVFPAIWAFDTLGNFTVFSDANFNSATFIYTANQYNIKVFSDTLRIVSYKFINNDYFDSNTVLSVGDSIYFHFNTTINTGTMDNPNIYLHSVSGGTFGLSPIYQWLNNNDTLVIQFSNNFSMVNGDSIIINSNVRDIFGNQSDSSFYITIYENAAPRLISSVFQNNDSATTYINAGDSFIITFSERMDTKSIADGIQNELTDTIVVGSGSKTFGNNANVLWASDSQIVISLGVGNTISDGDTFYFKNINDLYNNPIDSSVYLIFYDTAPPEPLKVYVQHNFDSHNLVLTAEFSETIFVSSISADIFNFDKGKETAAFSTEDSKAIILTVSNPAIPLIDTVSFNSIIQDNSIFKNSLSNTEGLIIEDYDSPYITDIKFLNNDTVALNTIISSGDSIIIYFNEPLKDTALFNSDNLADSILISGQGNSFGANPIILWNNYGNILSVGLTSGMSIFHNDGLKLSPTVFDYAGHFYNRDDTVAIKDNVGPVLKNIYLINNDTYTSFSAGDSLVFVFSESIKSFSINDIDTYIKIATGKSFGAVTDYLFLDNNETLIITLPFDFNFLHNDTVYLSTVTQDSFDNPSLSQYFSVIYDSEPPNLISVQFVNNDTNYTSFSAGDSLIFIFSEEMNTSAITLSKFYFANSSDTFGNNAVLVKNSSTELTIICGFGTSIKNGDSIVIDISVKDAHNNNLSSNNYASIIDNAKPIITGIVFTDNDTSSDFSVGDSFTITFSEEMDSSLIPSGTYSNLNDTVLISNNRILGDNVAVNWLSDTMMQLSPGTGFTILHNDTFSFTGVFLKDVYGNEFDTNSFGWLKDTAGPVLYKAYLNAELDSSLRTIDLYFNVPLLVSKLDIDSFAITGHNPASFNVVYDTFIRTVFDFPIHSLEHKINLSEQIEDANNAYIRTYNLPLSILDTLPVSILYAQIMPNMSIDTYSTTLKIFFNKLIDADSAANIINYTVHNNTIKNITVSSDSLSVLLRFENIYNISTDTLIINNIFDYADSNLSTNLIIESSVCVDFDSPYIKSISVINTDTNTDLSAGDTVIICFSEVIDTKNINGSNVDAYFLISSNHIFGTDLNLDWSDTYTKLSMGLGSNFNISYGDTVTGKNFLKDLSGNSDTTVSGSIILKDIYLPDKVSNLYHSDINYQFATSGYDNDSQINFFWTHSVSTDSRYYQIFCDTGAGFEYMDTTVNNYYNIKADEIANTYAIAVVTIDASNLRSDTAYSEIIKYDTIAYSVTNFVHSDNVYDINYDTDTVINLSWSDSQTDIANYKIYVDTGAGVKFIDTTIYQTFHYDSSINGETYQFLITAVDLAGNISDTKISIIITCDTGGVLTPDTPYHYDTDAYLKIYYDNDTSITFRWKSVDNADLKYYDVYYSIDSGLFKYYAQVTAPDTEVNIETDFVTDSTVQIKILARDNAGNYSEFSNASAIIKINIDKPYIIGITSINNDTNTDLSTGDTVIISFNEPIDVSAVSSLNFDSCFSISSNHKFGTDIILVWSDTYNKADICLGSLFTIKYGDSITGTIYLKDFAWNSDSSGQRIAIFSDLYPPAAVSNLYHKDVNSPFATSGYDNDSQINFFWTDSISTDSSYYAVYCDTGRGFSYIGSAIHNYYNLFADGKASTYAIAVVTVDFSNLRSDTVYSEIIKYDTIAYPPTAIIHTDAVYNIAYDTDNTIHIAWSDSQTDIFYYEVWIDTGTGLDLFDTSAEKTYTKYNCIHNETYQFAIKAIDIAGNTSAFSIHSIIITCDTGDVPKPDTAVHINENPNINQNYDNDTSLCFRWAAVEISDFKYYEIYYSLDSSNFIYYDTSTTNQKDVKINAVSDSNIRVIIRVRDKAGNFGEFSEPSLPVVIDTGVGKTVQLEPLNMCETNNVTPMFRWTIVSDAKYYRITVSFNSGMTSIYKQDTVVFGDTIIFSESLDAGTSGNWLYWKVDTRDTSGNMNTTDTIYRIKIDTYIQTAVLLSPANESDTNNYRPAFKWANIDHLYYILNIYEITETDTILFDSITTNLNYAISAKYFDHSGTYAYKVFTVDTAANISVSSIYVFTVTGINSFKLLTPNNYTDTNNSNPYFSWEKTFGDNIKYRFEFSTRQTFDNSPLWTDSLIVYDTHIQLTPQLIADTLTSSGTYYWRVAAIDSNNFSINCETYFVIHFDFYADLPQNISPLSNQKINYTAINFNCNSVSEIVEYTFEFCSDTRFSMQSVYYDSACSASNSIIYDKLVQGIYYWRIKVKDFLGNIGLTNYFKIDIDTFVSSTLVGLKNGIVNLQDLRIYTNDRTPTFEWQLKEDVNLYCLQVSRYENFSSSVFSETTDIKEMTISVPLDVECPYYYRVITSDLYGNSNFSETGLFVLDYTPAKVNFKQDTMIIDTDIFSAEIYIDEKNFDSYVINNLIDSAVFKITEDSYLIRLRLRLTCGQNNFVLKISDKSGNNMQFEFGIYYVPNYKSVSDTFVNAGLLTGTAPILIHKINTGEINFSINLLNKNNVEDTVEFKINLDADRSAPTPFYNVNDVYFDIGITDSDKIKNSDKTYIPYYEDTKFISIIINQLVGNRFVDISDTINSIYVKNFYLKYEFKESGVEPKEYGIFYLNPADTKWYEITDDAQPSGKVIADSVTTYEIGSNYIAAYLKHFCDIGFSIKKLLQSDNINNIVVYPNPFKPNDGIAETGEEWNGIRGGIMFAIDMDNDCTVDKSIPNNIEVKIYNMLGELVKSNLIKLDNGIYLWDGTNNSNEKAASGIYFAVFKFNGQKVIKRVGIVR